MKEPRHAREDASVETGDGGFALIAGLVLAAVIGGILVTLQVTMLNTAARSVGISNEAELRACLSAGLNRTIFAYLARGDRLREKLIADGRSVAWQYQTCHLTLSAQAESGKWDLNSGDRAQIAALLSRLTDDEVARMRVLGRIDEARAARRRLTSVAAVLTPFERMTDRRRQFEGHFTVATDQRGIDPLVAPRDTLEAITELSEAARQDLVQAQRGDRTLPNSLSGSFTRLFVGEKPIYTFRAEMAGGFGRTGAMEALVGFSDRGDVSIYSWARVSVSPPTSD